jgi:hypothetical protein
VQAFGPILVLALTQLACTPKATEALVTVSVSGLIAPDDFDSVLFKATADGTLLSSATIKICAVGEKADGCKPLPLTALFIPGARLDLPAHINVVAQKNGIDRIDDALVVSFVRDYTLRYDLVLFHGCEQTRCAQQNQTCASDGSCVDLVANNRPDMASPPSPPDLQPAPPRRVFLAGPHNGGYGGIVGANGFCQQESAKGAWLANGTYAAVLASSTAEPVTTLKLDGGPRNIVRADGKVVSTDETFWTASHANTINQFADGHVAGPTTVEEYVWAGFSALGKRSGGAPASVYCDDWTNGSGAGGAFLGYASDHGAVPIPWVSNNLGTACNAQLSLYCIEQ